MDYLSINLRLKTIRYEIHELRQKVITCIQEKIQALKMINTLLREQNRLLYIRQQMIENRDFLIANPYALPA